MTSKTPLSLITSILHELKLQFEEELSPDDPKLTIINTITPEQLHASGAIKSSSRVKVKSLIVEYISNYVQMRKIKTRSQSGTDLSLALRKDAGISSKPREEETQTQSPHETPEPTKQNEPTYPPSKPTASTSTGTDDTFDDELETDPNPTEFSKKYPALPRHSCPKNLFISNMHYAYLNSLYTTDRHSYPKRWNSLKNNDTDHAWHSLNQTMIPFLNARWKSQGVHFEVGGTPVDSMSYHDLKSSIIKTITDAQAPQGSASDPTPIQRAVPNVSNESILRLERNLSKLEEVARVLTSYTTKVTGRETSTSTPTTQSQPQLSGVPSTSGQQRKPIESDSEEEILAG